MKTVAGFVPHDRRAWHRGELLDLLGDSSLLVRVEQAENDYLCFVRQLASARETDKEVRADLEALAKALATLHRIYTPGGSAKAIFEGAAVEYVGTGTLQHLRDAVASLPGELLVRASTAAHERFQCRKHRQPDPIRAERLRLVDALAFIAKDAGIAVKRRERTGEESELHRLVAWVFDRVNIDTDADSVIRDMIEGNIASA